MAVRPVFITRDTKPFVTAEQVEFTYYPGFALSRSRKTVESLHSCFVTSHPAYSGRILEVSTKSGNPLGVRLSAFNLPYRLSDGRERAVECVFQSGKCFSNRKQYPELLDLPAADAKRFPALRESGRIVRFRLEGKDFPTEPAMFFYHWLYVNALYQNADLADAVVPYRAFTDIAFNPARSLNCQARSVALFAALKEAGMLDEALSSPERFLEIVF